MYKGKKILGLILARGKSKGLPGKNIKMLCGHPLIGWTIKQAISSAIIDAVVVSTDDKKIAQVALDYGAEVPFLRPGKFARDKSPAIDAIEHAVDYLCKKESRTFDYIVLLEPTSPLRKKGDIDRAIKKLIDYKDRADSIISLGEIHLENPFISYRVDGSYLKSFLSQTKFYARRQELPKVYFPYGVIYAARTKMLLQKKTFYQKKSIPYFIERWQNYEIDDGYDFICIEKILKDKLTEVL